MLKVYKTTSLDKKVKKAKKISIDSWIDLVAPSAEEIDQVVSITNINRDLIVKMLDDEERSRIETDEEGTLIVIETPYLEEDGETFSYVTRPLGIIISNSNYLVTVAPRQTMVLGDFKKNKVKDFRTGKKTRFIIQILNKTASSYLKALKVVNKQMDLKETKMEKSTSNKDLTDMLDIEKTLVYFLTALKANDLVLDKLSKGIILPLYEGDDDLLDDAMIENRQAIELSSIYREILSSITETYATVVSNNLNNMMKFLAGATIVLSIPTMIYSFMGMNVPLGFLEGNSMAPFIIFGFSMVIAFVIAIILKKKNML
ncbi:MAG TPA: magnesium transporter CorA family protein [Bacilli bacterium]|nr:magnesium transporter CorA family protein [Bacilli bacterium]HQC84172.1 magnesium transporter CorA family protein [Bacilli bacterium]